MDEHKINRLYGIMLCMAIFVAFAFQGSRGIYDTTEGRYAEVAREMLESDNYLEPTLMYRPHWTKPPLAYWAIVGGLKIFGRNEWGARFYNAIAFILTVLLVTHIGMLLWDKRVGIMAGFIYSTSIFTIIAMNTISTDTLLTLWETAAVYCYLKASKATDTKRSRKWMAVMWISFGLGFFTKGPPALLPLLAISTWHFLNRKPWKLFTLTGMGLFLVIGFWWYALVIFRHPELWTYFIGQELIARVATNSFHRNSEWYQPFILYIPLLTIGAGFWFYYLIRTFLEKDLFRIKILWNYLRAGKSGAFLFFWIFIPLLIFFISQSRLPLYVLPLYAPVALIIARGMGHKISLQKVILIAAISAMGLIGLKGFAAQYPRKNNMKQLFSICRDLGEKNVQVVSYLESKFYGLQFYLDGNLTRVSWRKKPWSDNIIENFIDNKVKQAGDIRYIFIAHQSLGHHLKNVLVAKGVGYKEKQNSFWQIYYTVPEKSSWKYHGCNCDDRYGELEILWGC